MKKLISYPMAIVILLVLYQVPSFAQTGRQVNANFLQPAVLLGDFNLDGEVSLLDIAPFVDLLINGKYPAEADING